MSSNVQTYKFNVEMTCEGCSNAITNVLNKHKDKGIVNFTIDLPQKLVTIQSTLDVESVLEILKKTGKTAVQVK